MNEPYSLNKVSSYLEDINTKVYYKTLSVQNN